MSQIPIIQGFWMGAPLSRLERLSLTSFVEQGHRYHLYSYEEVSGIPRGVELKDAEEILPRNFLERSKSRMAMFADMFRYKLLFEKGGFWVDTDIVCLRPFDFLEDYVFASEIEPHGQRMSNNGVIKTPAGAEIMSVMFEVCSQADIENLPWGATGPALLNDLVEKFQLQSFTKAPEIFSPVHWWQTELLVQAGAMIPSLKSAYAVHFWNDCLRRLGIDKNADYPNSLYSNLLREYEV